ncbi:methionine biosynthesis protein MetW [Arenicella xantha]|uniref:Methionine biosynthesis protein MetW n=1 Tax=Arenicella xantha TaxID=644221 RepID=A0A395JJ11_9GAMM|nr:methionine biosynthesis protein MetW [Arenicella xantha]RBP49759.1 methionine biosynthesis protein MetW [Arenicella xantha]
MNKIMQQNGLSRHDLRVISDWITPGSHVMDLGCGNGALLQHLQREKQVTGYGVELNPEKIAQCIENGVNVIQTNLDRGLDHFSTDAFDFVILSLTLQAMRNPKALLQEMMRVGKQGIVTFPNFAYWRNRLQIGLGGFMPVSDELPYKWYDTPNIHLCTIQDFHELCEQLDFTIESSIAVHRTNSQSIRLRLMPNLFGEIALCRFSKKHSNEKL